MKRRDFVAGSAAALTALHATNVRASTLCPCINQVTTLGAAFDAECSAYHDAGFRHVELWFPKLQGLGLAPPAIVARLRDDALRPVSACAAGSFLWRGRRVRLSAVPSSRASSRWPRPSACRGS